MASPARSGDHRGRESRSMRPRGNATQYSLLPAGRRVKKVRGALRSASASHAPGAVDLGPGPKISRRRSPSQHRDVGAGCIATSGRGGVFCAGRLLGDAR
jgi:hypothetical protein